jgi:anthranilate synthase/aminodeoxychorismate synthase-like glutamine amidotransferase
MKILLIDNYDSFTYNLYQYIGEILSEKGQMFTLEVIRNDEMSLAEIKKKKYDKIIISPGPGDPSDKSYFGVCSEVILKLGPTTPLLGVCLGMQGIAHYFGGKVVRAKKPMHGKTSLTKHTGQNLFSGLPQNIEVMRYHSLIVCIDSLPGCFQIEAVCENDIHNLSTEVTDYSDSQQELMGLKHKDYPIYGIQFHPESFATEGGKVILENFLNT